MRVQQPVPDAARLMIPIDGSQWLVVDPIRILRHYAERRKAGGWSFVLGCKRCRRICTDVSRCDCCQLKSRPYDLDGGHVRVGAAPAFMEQLEQSAAGEVRLAPSDREELRKFAQLLRAFGEIENEEGSPADRLRRRHEVYSQIYHERAAQPERSNYVLR